MIVSLFDCEDFEAELSVALRGGFCPKVTAPELNIVRTRKTATKYFIVATPLKTYLIVERIILPLVLRRKRRSPRLIQKACHYFVAMSYNPAVPRKTYIEH